MRLSADKELMGPLVSGRFLLTIGWLGRRCSSSLPDAGGDIVHGF